jgi:hypothetical protein
VGVPVLDRGTILAVSVLVFGLANIWPPLILIAAYSICGLLIPYLFRENDSAAVRRELFAQFCQDQDECLPDRFRNIRNYVNLEESYWTNERYVLLRLNELYTVAATRKSRSLGGC